MLRDQQTLNSFFYISNSEASIESFRAFFGVIYS